MKFGQIYLKFLPLMQWKVMHNICDSFCSIVKKWSIEDQYEVCDVFRYLKGI